MNGKLDEVRIYNRALSDAEVKALYNQGTTGLSCTTNTLGLPLNNNGCFYDGSPDWRKAILKKSGTVVAEASLAGNEGGFCASTLFWTTPDGTPITDWSSLFGAANSVAVEIFIERNDGTTKRLGARTAKRSQFDVSVTADREFPVNGPQAEATFTATPSGGTGPYTYSWLKVMDYAGGDGYGYQKWGDTDSATIELPAYGERYPSYPNRLASFNSLHPIDLQVTDSSGQQARVQCLAAVTAPALNGDPALSGSGSQLQRGVDVASGNYHLSATDLSVSGKGPDFVVTRAYNSNITKPGDWSFNLDLRAWFAWHSMGREITIGPREDGRDQTFYRELDGTWRALNPGNFDQLVSNADGSLTLYTQGNLLYHFADPQGEHFGRLEQIADRDGNALTFGHDSNDRLISATDAGGRLYTITRDSEGRITQVADFAGRFVSYTWNADDMITAARNPRKLATTYGYSGTRLTTITDPRGKLQATIAYCAGATDCKAKANTGRVKSVTDGAGKAWTYAYTTTLNAQGLHGTTIKRPATNNVNNNLGFVLDATRTRVLERVDSLNAADPSSKIISKTTFRSTTDRTRIAELALAERHERPSGAGTEIAYTDDGAGNPTQITDALNRKTTAAWTRVGDQTNLTPLASVTRPGVEKPTRYDEFTPSGKARTVQDALDHVTKREYDAAGLLTKTTDALQNSTSIAYDAHGRPIQVTDALGQVTKTAYDKLGRVISETNARGYVTRYTYDANGNVLTITDAAGGVTTHTYDNSDNLISTKDPRGAITSYEYDALNRKIVERYTVNGVGRVRKFEYDAMGRLAKVINEKGHATTTRFDARGLTLQEINPLSQTIAYTYDKNGNVLTVTDAEGRTITYQYDKLDRKTKMTDALGNFEQYTYNAQGLLASKRDLRGKTTRYEYDALGRMTKVTDPDGAVTTATYDANGNLTSTTDRKNQPTVYTYDALNRLIQQTDAMGRSWTMTYDKNGNLRTRTTPAGQKTIYTYDKLDRVASVSYPDGSTVSYTYDPNGNRLSMTDANGTTSYAYDEQNRLTSVTDAFGNVVAYRYDPAGLLSRLIYPGNKSVIYVYDAAERLKSLTDWLQHVTTYTRDKTGAVTAIAYGNGARVDKTYDKAGRLTVLTNRNAASAIISNHALTLDGVGNPISASLDLPLLPTNPGKAAAMLYDASNRMTTVGGKAITYDTDGRLTTDPTGSAAIEYAYNAQDLITRVTKGGTLTDSYVYDGDGRRMARRTGTQTTRYVLDPTGGDLYSVLAETDGSNKVLRYYIYGEGLVSQIAGGAHRYYHFDQSGNTLALTDSKGVVTDTYAYEPFGNTTVKGTSYNPFRFVGQYGVMDDGNGLHHMRARYYRPDLRRFVSLDAMNGKITDPMTLNRYQYVSGNPMAGVDPSGNEIDVAAYAKGIAALAKTTKKPTPTLSFDERKELVKWAKKKNLEKAAGKKLTKKQVEKIQKMAKKQVNADLADKISSTEKYNRAIDNLTRPAGHIFNAMDVASSATDYANGEISLKTAIGENSLNYVPVLSTIMDAANMGLAISDTITGGAAPDEALKRSVRVVYGGPEQADKYADEGLEYLDSIGVPTNCVYNPESCGLTKWEGAFMSIMSSFGAKEW